jgi:hypothetical protein
MASGGWTGASLGPGIRRVSESPNGKGCRSLDTLLICVFPSLRGLDLNQRSLGYSFCRSRSPQAYPLATVHLRSSDIP